jgi:hypothetical protein
VQRGEQRVEYIEVTLADIELANRIAHDVLGRSLDELPPQTRRLLKLTHEYVRGECVRLSVKRCDLRFSRKAVRDATALSDTQLRLHLARLVELEYLLVHRGMRGHSFEYELLYDGADNDERAFVPGLIDVNALKTIANASSDATTTASSRGQASQFAGSTRPQRGANAGGSRPGEIVAEQAAARVPADSIETDSKTHCSPPTRKRASHASYTQAAAATSLAAGA